MIFNLTIINGCYANQSPDNAVRTNLKKGSYVPAVATEAHMVDGNNANCMRYPSIPNCPVTIWVKFIRITDIQSPKGLIQVSNTL